MKFTFLLLGLLGLFGSMGVHAADDSTNAPFLAIWQDHDGSMGLSSDGGPFLRIAIWNDGRVVFAKDTGKWSHDLQEGKLATARLDELKQAIEKTGVFELARTSYLVPDASAACLHVDVGGQHQLLQWDEVEMPGYGINIAPKEGDLKFIRCWKEINRLALAAVPSDSRPYGKRFERPPASWRTRK